MESPQLTQLSEIDLAKLEKKRTYMREYKRRKYAENREKENQFHRSYLIKKKFGLENELLKKYGKELHIVVKIKQLIAELKDRNLIAFKSLLDEINIEI